MHFYRSLHTSTHLLFFVWLYFFPCVAVVSFSLSVNHYQSLTTNPRIMDNYVPKTTHTENNSYLGTSCFGYELSRSLNPGNALVAKPVQLLASYVG